MSMLLYGKPIADQIKLNLQHKVRQHFGQNQKYVAILFFGNNSSSATYVKHKQRYGQEIGLQTIIFGQGSAEQDCENFPTLKPLIERPYEDLDNILTLITQLNRDQDCVGIMIQLPLPTALHSFKIQLIQAIDESKDIDGLSGGLVGKSFFDMINFTPATPKAVMTLLDSYELGNLRGKRVAIIGQSNIVGKPLALECLRRGAILQCFDIRNTPKELEEGCQAADIILSGTGVIHLINERHLRHQGDQVFIDIGYGHRNGKPVGDIDFNHVKDKVKHITPVPGGVGPLTIASLFSNVIDLWEQKSQE